MITQSNETYRLCYGGLELPFQVERQERKNLSISVRPDRNLRVVAPLETDIDVVLQRVDSKAAWIARQWRGFRQQSESGATNGYFSGETHWYLGRPYRLKIRSLQPGQSESVVLAGRFLWVRVSDPTNQTHVERVLERWYRARARETFAIWREKCLANTRSLDLREKPEFELRLMQKRWGSCTKGGKILLNPALVKAPVDCIEYVITHELCHLNIQNHGPEFYRLLLRFLPDWKERKARLEEFGSKI